MTRNTCVNNGLRNGYVMVVAVADSRGGVCFSRQVEEFTLVLWSVWEPRLYQVANFKA